ncbi:T9SS type B sorting domain-containing protein [Flavobacterium sp. M31R6]|uniref:T9SS type B sorting domain-containing protein n=1 Tax=Flavobacterium sp. M31R6 TaxID=2739062 RepID=UPI001569C2D8|nr:T9SS type B sorting domain-containing protein [Flavobacterium sp. M31R6]QKJ64434.1 T9SS type B sorting domain-containing protein [Flavobacterium sp. M31R6]
MKNTLLVLISFFSLSCFAQFSKTHYIPPLISATGLVEDQYLYISTPSLTNVNFKIIPNGGSVIYGTVNSSNPYRYSIGAGDDTQLFTPLTNTGIVANKGYVVEAEDLIYVSARVNAGINNNRGYNHAGGLVSKGNSALGTTFRLGAMLNPLFDPTLLNFASILATENGTKVTISNLQNGTKLLDGSTVSGPITVTLNKNESYVLALQNYDDGSTISNSSKIIGALVTSDKPVVVNSGSFGGSNSSVMGMNPNSGGLSPAGRDVGFDQIVSLEKTGKEYVFVKGIGTDELERVLLVAHSDNTQIYLNGNATPFKTLNEGEYIALDGSQFINGNLYITATENLFAYQSIGGSDSPANQNLFFVPPINCSTPNTVDNIPQIQSIGNTTFNGILNIVTESGATVLLNNGPITSPPIAITGNSKFVRYTISGLSGNIAVKSTKQVYVSYFGTNGAATYGGYYSGFDLKPEIVSSKIAVANSSCIPNVSLKINSLSSYDTFQWYKDDLLIPSATNISYTPTNPGYYQVRGSISGCLSDVYSDKIPVSDCPLDSDNDGANNNIDIDWDNDGILNTDESNFIFVTQANPLLGSNFNGSVTGNGTVSGYPTYGFVSTIPEGKNSSNTYTVNFTKPEKIFFQYIIDGNVQTTPITDLANSEGDFVVSVPSNETLTITDPNNQLLIDTNFDGIYESGVKEFTSFEIRFRLKSTVPAPAGSLTFKIEGYDITSLIFKHNNLSDTTTNSASFSINTKDPFDSDLDGIPDAFDIDKDNDGIPDYIEGQGKGFKSLSGVDSNKDGLDNNFEPGLNPVNSDADLNGSYYYVKDVLDLDSDNDGIYDVVEAGHNALDSNNDGRVDGNVGTNGLLDILESAPDSGVLKYSIADSDADGELNYIEKDSDNDGCNDVIEAGFTDPDFDGQLGNTPIVVDSKGIVTSRTNGYTVPNTNYIVATPILVTTQPQNQSVCELQNGSFTIESNADGFKWQLSIDSGNTWNTLVNDLVYSGTNTKSLTIAKVIPSMNGYQYRVVLSKNNNVCGLTSAIAALAIYALPVLNSPITLVQCDDDTDGISNFNVTEKNSFISANSTIETFTYYTTMAGANTKDASVFITNPISFTSGNKSIWARVENSNGCFSIAQLNLIVSTTQINSNFKKILETCDDFIDATNDDKDGISSFDFSSVITDIQALLPSPSSNYIIKFYPNGADALAETNTIPNPSNYRNTTPNQQEIWVRIDSNLDNACFGLGSYVTLQVNPKPNIDTNDNQNANQLVCSNLPSFFVKLDAGIIDNTPTSDYKYIWSKDGSIIPSENNYTLNVNEEGIYTVTVATAKGCERTRSITVTASDIAHLNSIAISDLSDSNTVTANISGQGNYGYSIDLPNGPFQESNILENVSPGIHELYVHDKNGCGTLQKTIAVLGIPKFFTPNNDGYNDYWNIKGANETFNSGAKILIFDRYGKLIKQVLAATEGWDGTFIGNPMPADDYWYTIKLEDGREAKGHFSLQR